MIQKKSSTFVSIKDYIMRLTTQKELNIIVIIFYVPRSIMNVIHGRNYQAKITVHNIRRVSKFIIITFERNLIKNHFPKNRIKQLSIKWYVIKLKTDMTWHYILVSQCVAFRECSQHFYRITKTLSHHNRHVHKQPNNILLQKKLTFAI